MSKKVIFVISFLSIILLPLIWLEKGAIVIFFNQHRSRFFDFFFEYITYLGSVVAYVPFLAYFFWKRKYVSAIGLILVSLMHSSFVIFLKKIIFRATPRPVTYFKDKYALDLIDGIVYNEYFSFPSGHTATAFALILFLVLLSKRTYWVFIGVFIAVLIALSRIYLMQHFFEDVYLGMIIGSFSALASYHILKKEALNNNFYNN